MPIEKSKTVEISPPLAFRTRLRYPTRADPPAYTFRAVVKFTILCHRIVKEFVKAHRENDEIWPFIEHLDYSVSREQPLMFDKSVFQYKKERPVHKDVQLILRKEPVDRSKQEIFKAQVKLTGYKAIADYPVKMQQKIAQIGLYEHYEARRIVVRQGHKAHNFYFVLSGTLAVLLYDKEQRIARTVAHLSGGMSFGELAIMERTTRQAYVVSKTDVELLSIDIDHFHDIFMSGGAKIYPDKDYTQFLQSLPFLNKFPIEVLDPTVSNNVRFHYYKNSEVLVRDTNFSDWIFVVKTGSVSVLKTFPLTLPRVTKHSTIDNNNLKQHSKRVSADIESDYHRNREDSAPVSIQVPVKEKSKVTFADTESTVSSSDSDSTIYTPQQFIRTINDDFDNAYKLKREATVTSENRHIAQIQTLTKGKSFGIVQALYGKQTRFSLVSNGAECLMIDKKFFLNKCPKDVQLELRMFFKPYPSETEFQEMFNCVVDWSYFKRKTLTSVLKEEKKKQKTINRDSGKYKY